MTDLTPRSVATRPRWVRTLLIVGSATVTYVIVAFLATSITGDPILGSAVADLAATGLWLVYRPKSVRHLEQQPRSQRPQGAKFAMWTIGALLLTWVGGQTGAVWLYGAIGSADFDSMSAAQHASPSWLVWCTFLLLAPIGEEALLRGIAYRELRRHWSPLVASGVTALVFALMHGNLVQIALTLPLGVLLALVCEATQRLWPAVLLHVGFNFLSVLIPAATIVHLASPAFAGSALCAGAVCVYVSGALKVPTLAAD